MAIVDLEVGLSDQAQAARDTAHKFAEEVLRPAGAALDKLADPADVIAPDSVLWDVFRKYRELGFDELDPGQSDLGPVEGARLRAIISEEMGWGDAGLASAWACRASTASSAACPAARS